MVILVLNCGSSSIKLRLVELDPAAEGTAPARTLARGTCGGSVGEAATLTLAVGGRVERERLPLSPDDTVRWIVERLTDPRLGLPAVAAAGHRVVHGGTRFRRAVLIDREVLVALEAAGELAPLHNAPGLAGIRAARSALGPDVPMVAAFDTAFHASLPDRAALYAIPADLAARYGIRRFGFHGLSYQSILDRYCRLTGTRPEGATLVAMHLGNGCSAAAIKDGRSVDTSMGFTPLEGLVMGTRAGDLDPALVGYLARQEGVPTETVEEWLNGRSGLLGLSGLSPDMRTLLARQGDHPGARLAVEVFCYRARKYLGAYLAAMGGAAAVVFTGGIGENAPEVRARILGGMEWGGLRLDPALNAGAAGTEARISPPGTPIAAYVIPTDEETVIARETARCLAAGHREREGR